MTTADIRAEIRCNTQHISSREPKSAGIFLQASGLALKVPRAGRLRKYRRHFEVSATKGS